MAEASSTVTSGRTGADSSAGTGSASATSSAGSSTDSGATSGSTAVSTSADSGSSATSSSATTAAWALAFIAATKPAGIPSNSRTPASERSISLAQASDTAATWRSAALARASRLGFGCPARLGLRLRFLLSTSAISGHLSCRCRYRLFPIHDTPPRIKKAAPKDRLSHRFTAPDKSHARHRTSRDDRGCSGCAGTR